MCSSQILCLERICRYAVRESETRDLQDAPNGFRTELKFNSDTNI